MEKTKLGLEGEIEYFADQSREKADQLRADVQSLLEGCDIEAGYQVSDVDFLTVSLMVDSRLNQACRHLERIANAFENIYNKNST